MFEPGILCASFLVKRVSGSLPGVAAVITRRG
jgi:hypothetical protein